MPFLHLPVQSGSDRVLDGDEPQARRATHYRRTDRARPRGAGPDIALSSDFIVGFPGETEADFDETLRLVAEIGFASSFSFKYSPRPGTPAAETRRPGAGGREGRAARRACKACSKPSGRPSIAAPSGSMLDVLIEKPGRHPGQIGGQVALSAAGAVRAPTRHAVGRCRHGPDRRGRARTACSANVVGRRRPGRGVERGDGI